MAFKQILVQGLHIAFMPVVGLMMDIYQQIRFINVIGSINNKRKRKKKYYRTGQQKKIMLKLSYLLV